MSHPRLTIGAIFRGETPFLREWIEYHCLVGVERFYLYNNEKTEEEFAAAEAVLRPYVERGLVEHVRFPGYDTIQPEAFTLAVNAASRDGAKWLALIDLDEFLLPRGHETILQALVHLDRPDVAVVSVNWATFGTSNQQHTPQLQTETFVWRAFDSDGMNTVSKQIVRPDRVQSIITHLPVCQPGYRSVDVRGKPIPCGKRSPTDWSHLRINHYATRSVEDWERKSRRGWPKHLTANLWWSQEAWANRFPLLNKNDVEDVEIHRYLPVLRAAMGL